MKKVSIFARLCGANVEGFFGERGCWRRQSGGRERACGRNARERACDKDATIYVGLTKPFSLSLSLALCSYVLVTAHAAFVHILYISIYYIYLGNIIQSAYIFGRHVETRVRGTMRRKTFVCVMYVAAGRRWKWTTKTPTTTAAAATT